ncbi:MAG: uracil-DNA glycosylase, partial [Acidobacteria bacterium]|nr:uracil-DNA glycosylase [Acidobacteriota bacterium]
QIVFGVGSPSATVVLLAERPGRQDDLTGLPFSGPSGDLLHRILAAPKVEIPKHDVYVTNMVLCRAPLDRSPYAAEIKACNDRLHQQIAIIGPKLIVALGLLPMRYFLGLRGKIEEQRGWYETLVRGRRVPVFLTFNPASALYGQAWEIKRKKQLMYEDWKQIGEKYRQIADCGSRIAD